MSYLPRNLLALKYGGKIWHHQEEGELGKEVREAPLGGPYLQIICACTHHGMWGNVGQGKRVASIIRIKQARHLKILTRQLNKFDRLQHKHNGGVCSSTSTEVSDHTPTSTETGTMSTHTTTATV